MKVIRFILGNIFLALDKIFAPRPRIRSPEDQARVNAEAKKFSLYQFETCPYCIKVRRAAKRLNIPLETHDILKDQALEVELIREGGQRQVPCLRIKSESGEIRWMYESDDIIQFLQLKFS